MTDATRLYLGGRFENVTTDPSLLVTTGNLANIIQDGDVTAGSLRLVHNTRDFELSPATGGYEAVSVELGTVAATLYNVSNNVISSSPFDGGFAKTSVDLRRYFSRGGKKTSPNDKRIVIATRLLVGTSTGKLPFFEQFFVGGGESLRGYVEDRFWGTKMVLASIEVRKPIAQSIDGVVFTDYGDAWDTEPEFANVSINNLTQSEAFQGHFGVGVGIRVTTPIGHLRLDYGVGSEGARTHFSMGQAF